MFDLTFLATPILLISGIPQIVKLVKTKESKNISISMYVLTIAGVFLLLLASIQENRLSLILSNSVSLILLVVNLILIIKYKYE